jgi:hypothetical protein
MTSSCCSVTEAIEDRADYPWIITYYHSGSLVVSEVDREDRCCLGLATPFWLTAPHLLRALEADKVVLEGAAPHGRAADLIPCSRPVRNG